MQTQPTSITQANPRAQIQRFHPSNSQAEKRSHKDKTDKVGKTAITLAFSGIAFLTIGIASWGKLRAEVAETFHQFASCPIVSLNRSDLMGLGSPTAKRSA